MKAFEDLAFDKADFEYWVDETNLTKISDEQWKKVVEELDGRVANYLDNLIYDVVVDFREGVYDE